RGRSRKRSSMPSRSTSARRAPSPSAPAPRRSSWPLRVLDLPEGAEVITSPVTFVSAAQVIVQEGLRPVFTDVDPETGNLDIASVRARLPDRTGAVIPLRYGGRPCDLDELYGAAGEAGATIVE